MPTAGRQCVRRRRSNGGLTLVELLIALALVSLITLLLFSGLRVGSRAWEGVDAAIERTSTLRMASDFLVRTLDQVRPANVTADGESLLVFSGDAKRLEFVAPLSEHVGIPGLYILRLTVESQGDRSALVLTRWLIHPEVIEGGEEIPPWKPLEEDSGRSLDDIPLDRDAASGVFGRTLLLEDVGAFEVAYFGAKDGETEPDWQEEWFGQPTLPQMLRIHLATRVQSWPDLVVTLFAEGE